MVVLLVMVADEEECGGASILPTGEAILVRFIDLAGEFFGL